MKLAGDNKIDASQVSMQFGPRAMLLSYPTADAHEGQLSTLSSHSRSQKGMDSMVICCQLAHTKKGT
jgi:hypothetical protein